MAMRAAWLALPCLPLVLTGCSPGPVRLMTCPAATGPALQQGGNGTVSAELSVLTYNIEGLGWPARKGRSDSLRAIARDLAAMREEGKAPDVVLMQEMFSDRAKQAVTETGYPAIASGPGRRASTTGATRERLPGKARAKRGEIGLKLLGSGLAVVSRYPIVDYATQPFGRRSCAGLDCLANKGVMLARLAIPGVPEPVLLYNTHMNSAGASKAPELRRLAAHQRQAVEISQFIGATRDPAAPLIFGGDFNMRHSEERWASFTQHTPLDLVHAVCADPAQRCDVRVSWDGDAPWMDTQDLQLFSSGARVSIRPVRVEAMFDGAAQPRRSDHDGLLVTYRLSWRAGTAPAAALCGR